MVLNTPPINEKKSVSLKFPLAILGFNKAVVNKKAAFLKSLLDMGAGLLILKGKKCRKSCF